MKWKASDGTVVELGGKVTGKSALADALRAMLASVEWRTLVVCIEPPDVYADFDADNPEHMHEIVMQCALPRGFTVEAPEFERKSSKRPSKIDVDLGDPE